MNESAIVNVEQSMVSCGQQIPDRLINSSRIGTFFLFEGPMKILHGFLSNHSTFSVGNVFCYFIVTRLKLPNVVIHAS